MSELGIQFVLTVGLLILMLLLLGITFFAFLKVAELYAAVNTLHTEFLRTYKELEHERQQMTLGGVRAITPPSGLPMYEQR